MNDFLKFIFVGIVLFLFSLWLNEAHTEQLPKEMSMKTETGEIVLTSEPCEFSKMGLDGFPYAAYATEKGHANHEGCWGTDIVDRFKAVKIYFPEINATGIYNPNLFKPRQEPNVSIEPRFEQNAAYMFLGFRF